MKKTKKRAFTLVELLVVIAILAVLATVSAVGYLGFTEKANQSVDEQTVTQLNTALQSDEMINGIPVNPSDAMQVLEEAGFNVSGYEALSSKNTIYWDKSSNRVLIYTKGEGVTFPEEAIKNYPNVVENNLPKYWYELKDAYVTILLEENINETQFIDKLNTIDNNQTIQLQSDLELNNQFKLGDKTVAIDLNGFSLDSKNSSTWDLSNKTNLTIRNGNLNFPTRPASTIANIKVGQGASLTLEKVNVDMHGYGILPLGNAAQVNIIDSNLKNDGAYVLSTNASSEDNYNVIVNIENSTLVTNDPTTNDCTGILFNVAGQLNIENSTIQGDRQGIIVRAGDAIIKNSEIICTFKYNDKHDYENKPWGSGNEVPMAALVVGNKSEGVYNASSNVTLYGTKLKSENGGRTCYIEGNKMYKSSLKYDSSSNVGTIIEGINKSYFEYGII